MAGQSHDIRAIRQLAEAWASGWLAGDADALVSLYAEDPVLMPWGQPAVFGKEAIRSQYRQVFRDFFISSENTVREVEASGDLGYVWVTYRLKATPKAGGEPLEEEGKAVFIVTRAPGGAWKIARLIDNSDRAPAGG